MSVFWLKWSSQNCLGKNRDRVSIVDVDDLVLQHQGISNHNTEQQQITLTGVSSWLRVKPLSPWWLKNASIVFVNTAAANVLVPDDTKLLPVPNYLLPIMTFTLQYIFCENGI